MTSIAATPPGPEPAPAKATRRELRFESLADILADAEAMAEAHVTTLGGWTAAQNLDHVRRLIHISHAGADVTLPWFLRLFARMMKGRLLRSGMRPGLKTVAYFQPPDDITVEDALAAFRQEVNAASQPGAMRQPSPLLGKLSHAEWEQLHCRHAELHFGYVVRAS
ncbi:MAG: DUF1569 domain-containing protein [Planctomycetota bacterium]